ncbi:unnamed protein product [Cylindrotheca closterium]|uniref:HSF-type DNA-binding domain-containing protein n=1 Tax=Cylindrotheca closterium TaxID=2856 RepID=A0AAD2G1Z9_9STRA|nr:unnamed protein product [Cylindrotheca closterium]
MSMPITKPKSKTTTSRISFPQRVYNVLNLCDDTHQEHIASWMNDGTAFKVHDIAQFERELLPKYFNTQKYASFTRALCSYGFDCIRTGRQTGIYSHPKFNRNDPEAPSMIKRVKKTNNNAKASLTKLSTGCHGFSLGDRKRSFAFPSLMNTTQSLMNEDADASVFGHLYQTIRSQIADRTPLSHLVSSDESGDESAGEQSPYNPLSSSCNPIVRSDSYHIAAEDYDVITCDEQNQGEQYAQEIADSILDDDFATFPVSPSEGYASEDDDFEPLPWSPGASSQNCGRLDNSEDQAFLLSWSHEVLMS